MSPSDEYVIYEKLWMRARTLGAEVKYRPRGPSEPVGRFQPREHGDKANPRIELYRKNASEPLDQPTRGNLTSEQIRAELFTLAHEYGHFAWWKHTKDTGGALRAEWQRYNAAEERRMQHEYGLRHGWDSKSLTSEELQLIIDEETQAWDHGRRVLEDLGFGPFEEYLTRAECDVNNHKVRLGMEASRLGM